MNKFIEKLQDKDFLILTHRGSWQGNICQNTREAAIVAYKYGTDIVEIDVRQSSDGEYYLFHNGNEPNLLGYSVDFSEISSNEISNSSIINTTLDPSGYKVERLDDYLAWLPDDYLVNIDRSWYYFDDDKYINLIVDSGKSSQIFLKAPAIDEYLEMLNSKNVDIPFIAILNDPDDYYRIIEQYKNINYLGVEYIPTTSAPTDQELEFFKALNDDNKILLGNSINLGSKTDLFYGLFDDDAVLNNPDEVWGKMLDYGVNMIQTDFPYFLNQYRNNL